MIHSSPTTAVWLDIPADCHMQGEFDCDLKLEFAFGGRNDGVNLVFERAALERFITLATELLTTPVSDDPQVDLPKAEAPDATK